MSEYMGSGVPPTVENTNVVELSARRKLIEPGEPFLTNAERREIREMLAYFRRERPIYEAAKKGCTILRRLTEEGV
jgi:hypothetical protein